jgi:hypothetical protein
MAKIPLPERGQPLDLSYIYQLSNAVNELSDELSTSSSRYTSIESASSGLQTVKTSDVKIIGKFVPVTNNTSVSPDGEVEFSHNFTDFAYVPIVTATPILIAESTTGSGKDLSVVLTSVTTSQVRGVVRFNKIGVASVGVNLLIIGIPV